MKNLISISLIILMFTTVSAQEQKMTRKGKKAARKTEQIEQTKALIESNTWQFNANQMIPTGFRNKILTSPYNISVKDGSLDCYLPYYGRAYQADYASTESPLIFKSQISNFKVERKKKGGWLVTFNATNKNDRIGFTLHISENGSTTLNVNSTNRQPISFNGDLGEINEE